MPAKRQFMPRKRLLWFHTLLGLVFGVALGRWLLRTQPSDIQEQAGLDQMTANGDGRLTLDEILRMIEANGTAKGLDLSGCDLSGLDMSSKAIESVLMRRGIDPQTPSPAWLARYTWGKVRNSIDLGGVILVGANLQHTNLHGANITYANLQNADLRDACLQAANLYRSDLGRVRLWRADMRQTIAVEANFEGASLYRVLFENTLLTDANLRNAILDGANMGDAQLTRKSIGDTIVNEDARVYEETLRWDDPDLTWEDESYLLYRLRKARDIYIELLRGFRSQGYYSDASWAHYKGRSLDRQMHGPLHARRYFGEEMKPGLLGMLGFYVNHFVQWILRWAGELSCGYGERPLRTIAWAIAIIVTFCPLFWLAGGLEDVYDGTMSWIDYLNHSFGAFTTIGFSDFAVHGWATQTLTSFEALLGISTLALLMFALGNRISRS